MDKVELRVKEVIWLHVFADTVTAFSYFLIPVALGIVIRRRRDLKLSWMLALFGAFIVACGATHALAVYTLWHPIYRFEGVAKAITAFASLSTLVMLFRLLPQLVSLPTQSQLQKEIEERKAAVKLNETLRTLSAHQAVLESAGRVLVISTDLNGVITGFNRGAEVMLQYSANEMIGLKTPELFHVRAEVEERGKALTQQFGRPIQGFDVFTEPVRGGLTQEQEWKFVRKDGTLVDVSLTITAIREGEKITGFLGIARDISAQKKLERELREQNLKLQEHARLAQDANLAKGEFLANISHEIRTPMNGIVSMTGVLLDTEMTGEQREYTEIIRSSGELLVSLINDILDFSKIEARKLELEILDFDLRTTLDHTLELLLPAARKKSLDLTVRIDREVPTFLRGDSGRLRQILLNLCGNAVKFTPQGVVKVWASLDREDDSSAVVRISVEDSGIGIPVDRQLDIFSPFTQADASTTRKYGGTGLGLTICKRLVELLGGEIGLESQPGKGSTFWFTATFEKQLGHRLRDRPDLDEVSLSNESVDLQHAAPLAFG